MAELMPLRTAITRLYAAIFDPRQNRLFGEPIVCHVQPVQSMWRIAAWDNCDFGYPGDFETLDGLVTFVDNLALRQAPARLCYLINPWPDVDSRTNFHMTGHPLELRLVCRDWVITGTPSQVTAELVERQDPPGGIVIWSRRMEILPESPD
jgi:hypothetical protein